MLKSKTGREAAGSVKSSFQALTEARRKKSGGLSARVAKEGVKRHGAVISVVLVNEYSPSARIFDVLVWEGGKCRWRGRQRSFSKRMRFMRTALGRSSAD